MFSTMLEGQWRQLRGKIKEQWVYFDVLGLLHQVGAKP